MRKNESSRCFWFWNCKVQKAYTFFSIVFLRQSVSRNHYMNVNNYELLNCTFFYKSESISFKVLGQKSPCSDSGFLLTQKLISWQSPLSLTKNISCLDGWGGWGVRGRGSILWKNMAADHDVILLLKTKIQTFYETKGNTYEKYTQQISNLAFSPQVFNAKTNI